MAQYFKIHPDNPQKRLVGRAVAILRQRGVIVYPTDSCYALGCLLEDRESVERIRRIRNLNDGHLFTIICRDLSGLGTLAKLDNSAFRFIKSYTPGPYTFILKASSEVPKKLLNPKRRTIGLRVPDNKICQELLETLGEPMLSTSLILPGNILPEADPENIEADLGKLIDLIIDGGIVGVDVTTVIDLSEGEPVIIREGKGKLVNH
ncbi:MAG: tRNA threonylcarbamoyl adenosine modification protein (Sua5/YciO/YrdC/YwlC family) [Gammaproteobacteria bacterium]|jgi:tRNA threonylcarbamoyl adenosine modification protein (Sua5/YciO/YrdC/YwlC family)